MQKTLSQFMDSLWRRTAGMAERLDHAANAASAEAHIENIQRHFTPFVHQQLCRLLMGGLRYGLIKADGKPHYDRVGRCRRLLDEYQETGNQECLCDLANLAFLECVEGEHPLAHWASTDDKDHVELKGR